MERNSSTNCKIYLPLLYLRKSSISIWWWWPNNIIIVYCTNNNAKHGNYINQRVISWQSSLCALRDHIDCRLVKESAEHEDLHQIPIVFEQTSQRWFPSLRILTNELLGMPRETEREIPWLMMMIWSHHHRRPGYKEVESRIKSNFNVVLEVDGCCCWWRVWIPLLCLYRPYLP